jgi:hypothetical protein
MAGDLERLAYEASLRALDKQERLLEELRARAGLVLAGGSIATSFLGSSASATSVLATVAVLAFVVSALATVYVLTPRQSVVFAADGSAVYRNLYGVGDDATELHRLLAVGLDRYRASNDLLLLRLGRSCQIAAVALAVEICLLAAVVLDSIYT